MTQSVPTMPLQADAVRRRLQEARSSDRERWDAVLADARIADTILPVWACSEFVATACSRDSGLLPVLLQDEALFRARSPAEFLAGIRAAMAAVNDDGEVMRALRLVRRREMVRIAWRDLAGWAPVEETLADLTALADACISVAYEHAFRLFTSRHGVPRDEQGTAQPLIVLGMGKLGGGELNFSSDIDLVFLYPVGGDTDGTRSISNTEFFVKVGQKLIQLLAQVTPDGFVYRVDMRLRPFGDSGPLASSFEFFEGYLQQQGRDWERYAYVKARAITGVEYYAALYNDLLRPFVYRRYLDFSVFESLRGMKELIAREVERRDLRDNVKLGPGGIREIEFVVQAFQLIRGGSDRRLQSRELLPTLRLLHGQKLLPLAAVNELSAAYRFLRRVENRLQEWNDEQTHALPEDEGRRELLAYAMGYADWGALLQELELHRSRVSRHFEQIVFAPAATQDPADTMLGTLLEGESPPAVFAGTLRDMGFNDPEAVIEKIIALKASGYYRRLDEVGRRRLHQLLPRLLRIMGRDAHTPATLTRLLRILEMIGRRTVYLALLNDNRVALERLIDLCARSQFLAEQIAAFPLLLDELIDERLFEDLPSRDAFVAELAQRMESTQGDDPERQIDVLKQFQRAALFRIAVADLSGRLPLMKVSDRLTDLAELILDRVCRMAWLQLTERHGVPMYGATGESLQAAELVIVAYGKLGGLELGYGSDLDLVFLHSSSGDVQRTAGPAVLDNTVFFARLGQRIVHLLTVPGSGGRLYEIDTRLRPSGKGGLLVQSLKGFNAYQRNEAWTWEHQALLRARAVAGSLSVRTAFENIRTDTLRHAVRRETLREDVRSMRARMRHELSKAGPGQFDLKQDAGGIADIEFLTQYWMLRWADEYPEIILFSDNIRQLESLASGNIIPQADVDFLTNTYRKYRERMHHLSLDEASGVIDAGEFTAERSRVVELWRDVME